MRWRVNLAYHRRRQRSDLLLRPKRHDKLCERHRGVLNHQSVKHRRAKCDLAVALIQIQIVNARHEIRRLDFRELRRRGIGASVHFIPIPVHPFFARLPLARHACPRALDLYSRIVSLPLYPAMTEEQVNHVARSVKDILQRSRRVKFVASGTTVDADVCSSTKRCL